MIRQAEIQKLASMSGVRDAQTEKDYIISWILTGVSHVEKLRTALVFKGGTALKKFYFGDYRFSEDLDFTYSSHDLKFHFVTSVFLPYFLMFHFGTSRFLLHLMSQFLISRFLRFLQLLAGN